MERGAGYAVEVDYEAGEVDVDLLQMYKEKIVCTAYQRLFQLAREHNLSTSFVQSCLMPYLMCGLDDMEDLFDDAEDYEEVMEILTCWEDIVYNPSCVGGEMN